MQQGNAACYQNAVQACSKVPSASESCVLLVGGCPPAVYSSLCLCRARMSHKILIQLVVLATIAAVVVGSTAPSDMSHTTCLRKFYEKTSNGGVRYVLMNICSCDVYAQYATYNSTAFVSGVVRSGTTPLELSVIDVESRVRRRDW